MERIVVEGQREERQLLALHVCRRIHRVIDGRTKRRGLLLCPVTSADPDVYLRRYELLSVVLPAQHMSARSLRSYFVLVRRIRGPPD